MSSSVSEETEGRKWKNKIGRELRKGEMVWGKSRRKEGRRG